MKKAITNILSTLLVFTTIGCSSDSNNSNEEGTIDSGKEKTTVLDIYTNIDTFKDGNDSYKVKFAYDSQGKVTNHYMTYEAIRNNQLVLSSKTECSYYYDNHNQLTQIKEVNDKGKMIKNFVFEYDNKGQMIKSSDLDYDNELLFTHNNKKQIITATDINTTTNFKYDSNGNLANTFMIDNANIVEAYTYDNNPNPFKNMPVNVPLHFQKTTAFDIMYYYKPINNVTTYNQNNTTKGNVEYEYNKNKYPKKSITTNNNGVVKEEFSYKDIEIIKTK
ncbi:hypothetical protein [Myroides profundi]|uniref:DUF4595 domain-containing protein n=1 Tax=Myroides profundi TaxID=480520 RepID=A0AAJ4W0N0_MYRPR|nr:hypothetical protein [Myroides profundi]AJH13542.1 hypothetical protein MPR_0328 [Myroides profundi]SEP94572.1 hypothetical protein SAMN04488089_101162 [Myroides profundi]